MMTRLWQFPILWKGCVGAWCPSQQRFPCSTLTDYSAANNHGPLTNMTVDGDWVASQGKMALDFDGSNDYVDVGNIDAVKAANATMSLSAWVYRRSTAANNGIICYRNSASGWLFGYDTSGLLRIYNGSSYTTSSVAIPLNTWTHASLIYANSSVIMQINGGTGVSQATTTAAGFGFISLGAWDAGTFGCPNALLDDMRIYNRTLSAAEINVLRLRRGIAYEIAPRRSYRAAVAGGITGPLIGGKLSRQTSLIGGRLVQ